MFLDAGAFDERLLFLQLGQAILTETEKTKLEISDFFFRYSLSHGFPHDRNNLRSLDVPV